jgi:hypothetical protein
MDLFRSRRQEEESHTFPFLAFGEDEDEAEDETYTPKPSFLERRFGDMVGWSDNFGERKADEP